MISTETRARLMAARDDVFRAGDGHPNLDLEAAAAHIDRALRSLCPHLPVTWKTRPDEHSRDLITCYACGMSWYDHDKSPVQESYAVARQNALFMTALEERLETRAVAHGFAWVTAREGEQLQANGLYQPGHTIHRFSTEIEDRSDAALEDQERHAQLESERITVQQATERNAFHPRIRHEPRGFKSRETFG